MCCSYRGKSLQSAGDPVSLQYTMMRALLPEFHVLVGWPHRGSNLAVDERGLCSKCVRDVRRSNVRSTDVVVIMETND